MMTEQIIYWLTACAALLGVWLNIQKHVACFWIWMITNAVWCVADYTHGLAPQAAVQGTYFILSIYGIWRWTGRTRGVTATQEVDHAVEAPH